jgi:UDP-N-acetylglucosamine 1-carboxyvinyltransferase
VHHIERGYHRPYEQFASLGLRLTRDDGDAGTATKP